MRRFLIPSIIASSCLLVPGNLLAGEVHQYPECHKQPSETDIQGAKGAFQAGSVSFNEADYERAILYWEDALRRDCTATLLLHHLARAYEGQGNLQQAVVALKAYLERTPDVAERPQIQRRIEVFEQKIHDEEQRTAHPTPPQTAKDVSSTTAVGAAGSNTNSSALDLHLRVNPIIPIAVGGVGVAATIVGAIIYFPARSDLKDYKARCFGGDSCPSDSITSEAKSAESRRNWGAAVGITGLVLAAGGVGWYFFNEQQSPKESKVPVAPAFQPWVGPQVAGLSYSGSF